MAPIGVFFMWLLISSDTMFQIGMLGSPVSLFIIYWAKVVLIILYAKYVQGAECWGGWTYEALTDWWAFLRLALPGIFVVCSSIWVLELLNLAASSFGPESLSAQAIALQCVMVGMVVQIGMSNAITNRVGNLLGRGEATRAKISSYMAIAMSTVVSFFWATTLYAYRDVIPRWFNRDPVVLDLIARLLPLLIGLLFFAGIAQSCSGILIGVGRQKIAAWIKMVSIYGFGLPLGIFLSFYAKWKLLGLWMAYSFSLILVMIIELAFIARIDWQREVERSRRRVGVEHVLGEPVV